MSETTQYSIPRQPGRWRAITLAGVMHVALLAFLWIGIRWQSQTPVTIEAEVWSTQAREAAPKPQPQPEPQPEPRPEPKPVIKETPVVKPDIALEKEKKRKAEEKKLQEEEKERLKKAEEKKKADLAKKNADKHTQDIKDKARLDKLREDEMRRINGTGGSGEAPKTQGPRGDAGYAAKLAAKIRSNTVFVTPPDLQGNPAVEYDVKLFPDGTLRGAPRKVKSSGIPAFDDAVLRAIELSQPFPPDKSGTVPSGFPVIHQPKEK